MLNVCNWYSKKAETHLPAPINSSPTAAHVCIGEEAQPGSGAVEATPEQPKQSPEERRSASEDESVPLMKQSKVYQHLQQHDGVLTQADLHKTHLKQRCGFCGRWIAEAGVIKTHILRVHKELAEHLTADFHKACAEFKYLLKRNQHCRWCDRIVHGVDRHCSQCPVLFQLLLAKIQRQAVSASTVTTLPHTWPMPCPPMDISACLADPLVDDNHAKLKDMALVAKTNCLLCGEPTQDIQAWRRHVKQKHDLTLLEGDVFLFMTSLWKIVLQFSTRVLLHAAVHA